MSSVRSIALSCAGGAAGIAAVELLRSSTGLRLVAFDNDRNSYVQEIADEFHVFDIGVDDAGYGRRLLESVVEAGAGVLLPFHSGELGHIDAMRDEFAERQVKWPAPLLGAATVLRGAGEYQADGRNDRQGHERSGSRSSRAAPRLPRRSRRVQA